MLYWLASEMGKKSRDAYAVVAHLCIVTTSHI